MAKEIKVIQCPKCGSSQKIELKPDYFQCQNCNTAYFLDNDDININYHYNHTTPVNTTTPNFGTGNLKKVAWSVFAVLMALFFIARWVATCNTPKQAEGSAVSPSARQDFNWWHEDALAFIGTEQTPVLAIAGQRDYNGENRESKNGTYVSFYDLLSEKELKTQRLTSIDKKNDGDFKIKRFANGSMYIIINKTNVYEVIKGLYMVKDVTKSLFQNQQQLISGIANVEFIYDNYGDGFNIITNDGKNLYYYPMVNKLYTKEQLYAAEESFATLLPGAKEHVGFAFSITSTDYPEEKLQLIKYIYKDNNGGPKEDPRFEWATAYSAIGQKSKVFTNKERYRLLSWSDFTPGRMYFDPKVLYADQDYVLISYKNTAAEKAPTSVQCLNAKTGAIIFTTPFTEEMYLYESLKYRDGFAIKSNVSTIVISMNGKVLKIFKTI